MQTQILLIPGALGSTQDFDTLSKLLSPDFLVKTMDLPGHCGSPFLSEPQNLENLRSFLNQYINHVFDNAEPVIVFGHSMGGYLGLYAALHKNPRIQSVITIGTKMHWNADIAAGETQMLDAEKIQQKVPAFAASLAALHGETIWPKLVQEIAGFLKELGAKNPLAPEAIAQLEIPCRLLLGDHDKMVGLDETVAVFKSLSKGTLSVLPNTPHAFAKANMERLAFEIRDHAASLAVGRSH